LTGANSRFVNQYSWSIVSTPVGGEAATLSDANTTAPLLTAPFNGPYVIRLTASNGSNSDSDTVTINVNSALMPDPKDLIFMDAVGTCQLTAVEICTIFQSGGDSCDSCHVSGGPYPGIPVFWTESQPIVGTTFYEEVLARVNFIDPTRSLILTKPTGEHHFGNLITGFDVNNPADRQNYDLVLNWILEGAREN
jgi:hypothetical protein